MELEEVWHPPMGVANAAAFVRHTLPEAVEVDSNGRVTYRQGFIGTFAQQLDLKDFPFDTQLFCIHFVAPGLSPAELDLVPDETLIVAGAGQAAGIAEDVTLPHWHIAEFKVGPRAYEAVPGLPAAGYAFEFEAERASGHYVLKVILPLLLIVMMSRTVFWIDSRNAGSQISVAVTSMLTLIAYRFAVGGEVPRIPYTTRLHTFILASTTLVFALPPAGHDHHEPRARGAGHVGPEYRALVAGGLSSRVCGRCRAGACRLKMRHRATSCTCQAVADPPACAACPWDRRVWPNVVERVDALSRGACRAT